MAKNLRTIIRLVVITASVADFSMNSPVCGYGAKKARQLVQKYQSKNVRVGWGLGKHVFSDRTIGKILDCGIGGIEGLYLISGLMYRKKKKEYKGIK